MSQFSWNDEFEGQVVDVLAGWDRALNFWVQVLDEDDECLFEANFLPHPRACCWKLRAWGLGDPGQTFVSLCQASKGDMKLQKRLVLAEVQASDYNVLNKVP